jgi:hypothetical protein
VAMLPVVLLVVPVWLLLAGHQRRWQGAPTAAKDVHAPRQARWRVRERRGSRAARGGSCVWMVLVLRGVEGVSK